MSNNKTKILIIDDDKFLLDMYSIKFSSEGFQVDTSLESKKALAKLEDESYEVDIILMDIVMPSMDGFELLSEIKNKNLKKDTFIVVLSNLGEGDEMKRTKKLGADGYIIKANATPSEVVEKVIDLANNKK